MADETLKRKVREKFPPELQEAREEFEEEYLPGVCDILVDAGEFDSVEECVAEGKEEAKRISRKWAEEYPEQMAEFLR